MGRGKWLVAPVVVSMLAGGVLAGCGSSESANSGSASSSPAVSADSSAKPAASASTAKFDKKLSLNLGIFDATDFNDDISKLVESKFNVDLKLTVINWDTWADQVNTMTASGDMPDMLVYDMKPENLSQYKKMATQGVIRDIPVLDNKYPNLAKLRETMPVVNQWKIDGKLYAWPEARGENPYNMNSTQFIVYRQDWAKKLG